MHPTKLQGIIPPMITPLKGDDELDREGTVRLTEHLVAGGVHAIFLLGTTGEESPTPPSSRASGSRSMPPNAAPSASWPPRPTTSPLRSRS